MSVSVLVNNVDKTTSIDWRSLRVTQVLTSQPDNCRFSVRQHGAVGFVPAVNDEILVMDGGTAVFGGIVIRVHKQTPTPGATEYSVEAVSYERALDRYLVVASFESKSARFIINNIVADYVNTYKKVIASGESTETWTDEAGTSTADTTNFLYGSRSRKLSPAPSTTSLSRYQPSTLDLTKFDNNFSSDTSDQIGFWVFVENIGYVSSIALRLGNETGGTYTNYFEKSVASTDLVTGWNYLHFAKSAFTSTGSPSWSAVTVVRLSVTANSNGTANVSFDDVRLIDEKAFTQEDVNADVLINYAKFNYENPSECIRQMSEQTGYDWYVDENRSIHFFPPETITAPFSLDDTTGNHIWGTLELSDDISGLRNQIYVRGGEYLGSSQSEDLSPQVNGTNKILKLGYRYNTLSVTDNAVPITIGIDNIDDPASYTALYNFDEKVLKFLVAPTAGHTIIATGYPYIPVIVKKRDAASIASFGVFEHRIIDKTINTLAGARQRAQAELETYRDTLNEGSFQTLKSGLHTGQQITIDCTLAGVDNTYLINKLTMTMNSPTAPKYTVGLVSTRAYGMIEFLLGLLRKDAKAIEIGTDEVLDLVETIEEVVPLTSVDSAITSSAQSDAETATGTEGNYAAINAPPNWCAGPYSPTAILPTDNKRPAFCDTSCYLNS